MLKSMHHATVPSALSRGRAYGWALVVGSMLTACQPSVARTTVPVDESLAVEVSQEPEPEPDLAAVDAVAGVPTETITFDETDPNPGPTDLVVATPERAPGGSLLTPDVLAGPTGPG